MKIDYRDILILINPNAGNYDVAKLIQQIEALQVDVKFIATNDLAAYKHAMHTEVPKYKAVLLVGGDGTLNKAINDLYKIPNILVGVYPVGSGNGFARELGFVKSIKKLIAATHKGNYRLVDLISVNGHICINVAGVGIDSHVAHLFQHSKARGLQNYMRNTAAALIRFKPFTAKLVLGDRQFADNYLMINIANTRQFGNNAIIAPFANPQNNKYEIVLVKPIPFYAYPGFIYKLFSGRLRASRYINYIQTDEDLEIITDQIEMHIDGEPVLHEGRVKISLCTEKLRVVDMQ